MSLSPEELAQVTYEAACRRRESAGKDMIRSPGPAQTQRIFVDEISAAIREAVAEEAVTLRARVARLEAALDRAVDAIHHAQMCACLCGDCVRRFNALTAVEKP